MDNDWLYCPVDGCGYAVRIGDDPVWAVVYARADLRLHIDCYHPPG